MCSKNYFYLNETLGDPQPLDKVVCGMHSIIDGFCKLVKVEKLQIRRGWVLEKEADKVWLAGHKLLDIVESLDITHRRLFYSYTTLYPIYQYYKNHSDDDLLTKNYEIQGLDATNIAIVATSKGSLLSLPMADWLCVDQMKVVSGEDMGYFLLVNNLYGAQDSNIQYISNSLLDINRAKANGIEKLKLLTHTVVLEDEFERRFIGSPEQHQGWIIERFEEAKQKNVILPTSPNGTIVKKVEKHVFELRIVNPVDIRVYFYEKENCLYISSMALKSEYVGRNDQDEDIEKAERVLAKYDI